ncbi:MAG: PilZ domain-containing protein [Gemmataceae bacterium]
MPQPTTAMTAQSAPAALKGERRVSVRFESNTKGSCQTLSIRRESAWEATVRNISCEGIGLLLGRRFEPGALLAIELTESSEGQQRLLLARVAHATAQPDGKWLIGCILVNPLGEDEIPTLL